MPSARAEGANFLAGSCTLAGRLCFQLTGLNEERAPGWLEGGWLSRLVRVSFWFVEICLISSGVSVRLFVYANLRVRGSWDLSPQSGLVPAVQPIACGPNGAEILSQAGGSVLELLFVG